MRIACHFFIGTWTHEVLVEGYFRKAHSHNSRRRRDKIAKSASYNSRYEDEKVEMKVENAKGMLRLGDHRRDKGRARRAPATTADRSEWRDDGARGSNDVGTGEAPRRKKGGAWSRPCACGCGAGCVLENSGLTNSTTDSRRRP